MLMASFSSCHRWMWQWQTTETSLCLTPGSLSRSSHEISPWKTSTSHPCLSQSCGAFARTQLAGCMWQTGNTAFTFSQTLLRPSSKGFWRVWIRQALSSPPLWLSAKIGTLFWSVTRDARSTEACICRLWLVILVCGFFFSTGAPVLKEDTLGARKKRPFIAGGLTCQV